MNKGIDLWNKAKMIIPGGSQLLSKRSEMFLPDHWPSYYSKAKGIEIFDLDGKKYIDMCIMGIGTCILGYADDDVNNAVKNRIERGNMATLNCPEEVELAEKLLSLNPWAGGVRYTRCGGEAVAVATRVARAYSKKGKIAFCGYHGWHDWYLAANIKDGNNLNDHLLKGLKPLGVPRELEKTVLPFHYNKIGELEQIVEKNNDIGVICMEPMRSSRPKDGFLQKVRNIANSIGAVLIFDEVSSGFRINVGGAYKELRVNPDIVVFAKAMSNGYPMAAIVGKKEIMDISQESFISSTYWSEGIGPTAALATIKKMEQNNVPAHVISIGEMVGRLWEKLGKENDLNIHVDFGFPPVMHFDFEYENKQAIATLFTQEMLKRGYLASRGLYVSFSHKSEDVKKYGGAVDEAFSIIKKAIDTDRVEKMLNGPIAHSGFQRLT